VQPWSRRTEDLEGADACFFYPARYSETCVLSIGASDRVVDVELACRDLQHLGKNLRYGPPCQVVLAGAE